MTAKEEVVPPQYQDVAMRAINTTTTPREIPEMDDHSEVGLLLYQVEPLNNTNWQPQAFCFANAGTEARGGGGAAAQ